MLFFALPVTEPFWLLIVGLLFLVSASVIQFRLARKNKVEGSEIE